MPRIIGGMGIVTRPAGTALHRLVDMDEVKVLLAVSEPCQSRRLGVKDQRFFMAIKAEIIVLRIERSVKHGSNILPQYPEVIRTMGVVAARAIALFYGSVGVFVLLKKLFHVHDLPPRRI